MNEWFECKISYEREIEGGKFAKISEGYLVDAVNFIEAETRLYEKMKNVIDGEFKVETVKREKVYEIFRGEYGDTWFKCKVEFVTIDETSGKEKKTKAVIYLQNEKFENVAKELNDKMANSMSDYDILSINKTNLIDVFEYEIKQ